MLPKASNFDLSYSGGFLSEKTLLSFGDVSLLYNLDDSAELYGTLGYLIFGGSLGFGFKYYKKGKFLNSTFVSVVPQITFGGSNSPMILISGLSISPGFSVLPDISKDLTKKNALNVGISFMYGLFDDSKPDLFIIPFLNLEYRILDKFD